MEDMRIRLSKEDFNVCYYKNYEEIYLTSEEKEIFKKYILFEAITPYVIYFDAYKREANKYEFLIKCSLDNIAGGNTLVFIVEFASLANNYKQQKGDW